jgi:hypothetical protein
MIKGCGSAGERTMVSGVLIGGSMSIVEMNSNGAY